MLSKRELKKKQGEVDSLLEEQAKRLGLGVKGKSLERLEQLRNDNRAFSAMAKLEFCEYVRRKIGKRPAPGRKSLETGGARLLGLSTATTKRYMDEFRSAGGPFIVMGEAVQINPRYVPPEEDDYWTVDEDDEDDGLPAFMAAGGRL